MTTPSKMRTAAVLLTVAVIASACGGSDGTDEQAVIEELQAQVDELTETVEQSTQEQPTPTTTEAAPVTTAAPPVTETAEAETTTTAAPDVEPAPIEESSPQVASGTALNASLGVVEAAALVTELSGPTTDLSAQMLRVDPHWPPLETLPDTEIEVVFSGVRLDVFEDEWSRRTAVWFTTSASATDSVLAYQTTLASFFPDQDTASSNSEQNGRQISFSTVGPFQIQAEEVDGRTEVQVTNTGAAIWGAVTPSDEEIAAYDGILAEIPVPDNALVLDIEVNFRSGRAAVETSHFIENVSLDEVLTIRDDELTAAGWTLDSDEFGTHESPNLDTRSLFTSLSEIEASDVRTQGFTYSVSYDFNN